MISVGQNRIGNDNPADIVTDIIECVNRYKEYGVNQVLVSSLTCRPGHDRDINEVNAILKSKQFIHDFILIFNENIHASHIWRDDIHLNNWGRNISANNIINAVNRAHGP